MSSNKPSTKQGKNPATVNPDLVTKNPQLIGFQQRITLHHGILPSPEQLEKYESIAPGFANRLLTMVEGESGHRRDMERGNSLKAFIISLAGVGAGLIAIAMICGLCYYAFLHGFGTEAATIACSVIVSLAALFLGVRVVGSKSKEDKSNPK